MLDTRVWAWSLLGWILFLAERILTYQDLASSFTDANLDRLGIRQTAQLPRNDKRTEWVSEYKDVVLFECVLIVDGDSTRSVFPIT